MITSGVLCFSEFDRLRYFFSPSSNDDPLAAPFGNGRSAALAGSGRKHLAVNISLTVVIPIAMALLVCVLFSGCQTLAPFSQTMRTRVAAARQWSGNGIAAIRRGAVREARECFAKASSQLPHDQEIMANVARTHFQEGDVELAIEVIREAIEINGDDPELLVQLGEYYLADGQPVQAQHVVDRTLNQNRRWASAWLLKGKIHAAKGEHQAALADFQKSLGIDNDCPETQLRIVETYRAAGNPLRALSAVEQLLDKYPIDQQPESAILEKSAALVQLKQHDSAMEVLAKASKRSDVSSEVFAALAQIQILTNKKAKAWETLQLADARFPNHPKITQFISEIQPPAAVSVASLE